MKKLHSLQALRALAALLVVADHSLTLAVGSAYPKQPITSYAWFLGEQGVAIFFIISGFIMVTTTYNLPSSISTSWNFLKKRALRVVPLYWLYTALACVLIALNVWNRPFPITPDRVANSALFLPYSDGLGAMRPILGPGWTLNYEMGFYLAFSLLLLLGARAAVVGLWLLFATLVALGLTQHQPNLFEDPRNIFEFWSNPIILLFAAGATLGLLRERFADTSIKIDALSCAIVLMTASFATFTLTNHAFALTSPAKFGYWAIDLAIVSACIFGSNKKTKLETLGDASYTLYLSHIFVLLTVAKIWKLAHLQQFSVILPAAAALTSIPAALLAYRYIEKPITEALQRASHARTTRLTD